MKEKMNSMKEKIKDKLKKVKEFYRDNSYVINRAVPSVLAILMLMLIGGCIVKVAACCKAPDVERVVLKQDGVVKHDFYCQESVWTTTHGLICKQDDGSNVVIMFENYNGKTSGLSYVTGIDINVDGENVYYDCKTYDQVLRKYEAMCIQESGSQVSLIFHQRGK